jgi:hypothetical protein
MLGSQDTGTTMLTFTKIQNGKLLFTYDDGATAFDGIIERYRVIEKDWAVCLSSHDPSKATPVWAKIGVSAGTLFTVVTRDSIPTTVTVGAAAQLGIVQAIQMFKAAAFDKLAQGIGQATVDLS